MKQPGSTNRVLVIDDDSLLLDALRYSLERAGYEVQTALTGKEGLQIAQEASPDLIILDLGLPDMDGFAVFRLLRQKSDIPVIFLTARDRETDIILGLERGGDDYVTKPFRMGELVARVGAVLRRARDARERPPQRITIGEITLDMAAHEVTVRGKPVNLPPKEYALLQVLMTRAGQALSRHTLLDEIWGTDYFGDPRVVDVHIRWLRELVEPDPTHPRYILTVRGVGYKFADHVQNDSR